MGIFVAFWVEASWVCMNIKCPKVPPVTNSPNSVSHVEFVQKFLLCLDGQCVHDMAIKFIKKVLLGVNGDILEASLTATADKVMLVIVLKS